MKIPIISGSSGLSTQADPARAVHNKKYGLFSLAACLNIDICDEYRISRRRGMERKVALAAHSLVPVDDLYCLFVSGDKLYRLEPDLESYEAIATVTPNLRVSAVVVDQIAYWLNGVEMGKVMSGTNVTWAGMPDVVSNNLTRQYYGPPQGRFIAYYNGRIYIAAGKEVWYSEPYAPDVFSLADSFLAFESEVMMVRPVADGIFISDSEAVWFLSGNQPVEFTWSLVEDRPALPYSDVGCVGSFRLDAGQRYRFLPGGKKEAAFWLNPDGVVFGAADGSIHNISEEKIDIPGQPQQGAILLDGKAMVAQFI